MKLTWLMLIKRCLAEIKKEGKVAKANIFKEALKRAKEAWPGIKKSQA